MQYQAAAINSNTFEEEFNVTANYTEADITTLKQISRGFVVL